MRIAVAADEDTGVARPLVEQLRARGHEPLLHGALNPDERDDWAWASEAAARDVADGRADQAVVCCWTGTGASIAANKVAGIRAALCVDAQTAAGARRWNDANVLALSLRSTSEAELAEILDAWFDGPAVARRRRPRERRPSRRDLDLEPLVLEVELALEPVHDLVGDRRRRCAAGRARRAGRRAPRAPAFWYLSERCSMPSPSSVSPARAANRRLRYSVELAHALDRCRRRSTPRRPARRAARARASAAARRPISSSSRVGAVVGDARARGSAPAASGPGARAWTRITANVSSRIRSRCGKSAWSASAAASETEPRMPDQRDDRPALPRRAALALTVAAVERAGSGTRRSAPRSAA